MFVGLRVLVSTSRYASNSLSCPFAQITRSASKKAKGSSKNGRDSIGKRLGPKVMDGEYVSTGNILVRQRGTKMHAGVDVAVGRDYTLYALAPGIVRFVRAKPQNGKVKGKVFLRIDPPEPHRYPSIERKLARQARERYSGPILHPPL
jgi:large subunit ribosomal protein L27